MPPLILASASPRRHVILRDLGVSFNICLSDCEEIVQPDDPVATVGINALRKAHSVRTRQPHAVILAADTVVTFQGRVLGKPRTPEEAHEWLLSYAGNRQQVYTAVAFLLPEQATPEMRIEASSLLFRDYGIATVRTYINRVHPFDRAGAYDIAADGDLLIAERIGSYTNVMGLPRGIVRDWLVAHGILPYLPKQKLTP